MNNSPSISVILIAFNEGTLLPRALENLQKQTFRDFEVILVDDGSTDQTKEIMEAVGGKDSRFRYYYQNKEGIAAARNLGISHATGKYIIHHDGDDYMPVDALKMLYEKAEETKSDMVIGDYVVVSNSGEMRVNTTGISNANEFLKALLTVKIHAGLWNKLIRREFYEGLNFENNINFMEDELILFQMMLTRKIKIIEMNQIVYFHILREKPIQNIPGNEKIKNYRKVILKMEKLSNTKNMKLDFDYLKFRYKLFALLKGYEINFRNEFKEVNNKVLKIKHKNLFHKILVFCKIKGIDFLPDLYLRLKN